MKQFYSIALLLILGLLAGLVYNSLQPHYTLLINYIRVDGGIDRSEMMSSEQFNSFEACKSVADSRYYFSEQNTMDALLVNSTGAYLHVNQTVCTNSKTGEQIVVH